MIDTHRTFRTGCAVFPLDVVELVVCLAERVIRLLGLVVETSGLVEIEFVPAGLIMAELE